MSDPEVGAKPRRYAIYRQTYRPHCRRHLERDLLSGLGKPVGVAVPGDAVYVSDQAHNDIVKSSLSALRGGAQAGAPGARIFPLN